MCRNYPLISRTSSLTNETSTGGRAGKKRSRRRDRPRSPLPLRTQSYYCYHYYCHYYYHYCYYYYCYYHYYYYYYYYHYYSLLLLVLALTLLVLSFLALLFLFSVNIITQRRGVLNEATMAIATMKQLKTKPAVDPLKQETTATHLCMYVCMYE